MYRLKQVCSYCTYLFSSTYFTASNSFKDKITMSSWSVKQKTSLMFVTLKCYGSCSQMSPLSHTKQNFCSWLQIKSFASVSECLCKCKWICSRVQVNLLMGTHELACGSGWTNSRVQVKLLTSTHEFACNYT